MPDFGLNKGIFETSAFLVTEKGGVFFLFAGCLHAAL